jgi:hypothetical protein
MQFITNAIQAGEASCINLSCIIGKITTKIKKKYSFQISALRSFSLLDFDNSIYPL